MEEERRSGPRPVMTPEEVESVFVAAAKTSSLVWLTEPSGRYRIVEPYMVYVSSTGRRLLHCFQIGGYSAGGVLRGWKNPGVESFESARVVDERFTPREDYNPFNEEMFPRVVFALPTRDGRMRPPDPPPAKGSAGVEEEPPEPTPPE